MIALSLRACLASTLALALTEAPDEPEAPAPGTSVVDSGDPGRAIELPRDAQGGDERVRSLYFDGEERVVAGGKGSLFVVDRDGQALREALEGAQGESVFIDADGSRGLGGDLAVFVAADGGVVRWSPGSVAEDRVPLLEGDELVAVAVDSGGFIYAIGKTRALYERGNLRWRVYPYPETLRPLDAAATPGGTIHLVGRDGMLVRFRDGEWDRPLLPGLSPESIEAPWTDAWYSDVTQTLWVRAGRDRLLELRVGELRVSRSEEAEPPEPEPDAEAEDETAAEGPRPNPLRVLGTVPVREHPIPLGPPRADEPPPSFAGLAGISAATGDRVVATAGGQLWLFERDRFVLIDGEVGLVHALTVDEAQDRAWIASQAGLSVHQLRAVGEAPADDPLPIEDQRLLDRLARREAREAQSDALPEIFWMPTLRIDNGVTFPLGARPPSAYSLEVGAGAMLAPLDRDRGPTLWVWPELAYRLERHESRGGHLFDVGVGLGFGTHVIAAYYRPRLVLGGIDVGNDGEPGVYGLRHGLALEALWGVLGLEFSHQYLGSNEGSLTDLRLGVSVNLVPLVWGAILWATLPTNR